MWSDVGSAPVSFIAFSNLKNGLWGRSYNTPTLKAVVIASVLASVIFGILNAVRAFVILKNPVELGAVVQIAALCVGVFILCFALMEVFRLIYKKRRGKLDDIEEEEEK